MIISMCIKNGEAPPLTSPPCIQTRPIVYSSFTSIFSYTKLRDDPGIRWREEVVSEAVVQTIYSYNIDTVLTFDRHGVSGHKNHSSVYSAMSYLGKYPDLGS